MIRELQPVPGRFRALCCRCGEVRTFSIGYGGGNQIGDEGYVEERCTVDLKCGVCGRRTRHAYLLDNVTYRDIAETPDRPTRPRPAPPRPAAPARYDPYLEATERWSAWTFVETPLPDGIIEIIDTQRCEAYYDPAGWQGDSALGLAHVLAHLDLRHHELLESFSPVDQLYEQEAERVARGRLDDASWPEG